MGPPTPTQRGVTGDRRTRWVRALTVLLPAALVLLWHATRYLPFFADDGFISLRYSERLLTGHGLTWTDGPRVEGYSNLLWVLSCSLLGLAIDLVSAARLVGASSALVVLGTFAWLGSRSWNAAFGFSASALGLVLLGPFALWTLGGLEQPLVCACVSVATAAMFLNAQGASHSWTEWLPGAAFSALVLTRPDGPLFVMCGALAVAFLQPRPAWRRTWVRLVVPPAIAFAAQLAFRLAYYDAWVPHAALLKTTLSTERIEGGWLFLSEARRVSLPLLVATALTLLAHSRSPARRWWLLTLLPAVVWTTYITVLGGDLYPGHRHLVVAFVLLALQLGLTLSVLLEAPGVRRVITCGVGVGFVVACGVVGLDDPRTLDAHHEHWEWDAQVTGTFFARVFPGQPTMAVDLAGALPFFSKLPVIDMLGINDADAARRLPDGWSHRPLGFALHDVGDPAALFDRHPDLIVPCTPQGSAQWCPWLPASTRLFAHPRFRAEYVPADFRADALKPVSGTVWVRRESALVSTIDGVGLHLFPATLAHDGALLTLNEGRAALEVPAGSTITTPIGADLTHASTRGPGTLVTSIASLPSPALIIHNDSGTAQLVYEVLLER